jgi:hypothetical protein
MKRRSVWVVAVASMMLLATSQTDHAFAALNSLTRNSTPQGISSASWAAVAGVDQNVTSADRAGSAYSVPWTSTSSPAPCTVIHWALYESTTAERFQYSGTKVFVYYLDPNVMIGMPVSGPGIVANNTLEKIDRSDGTIYLTMTLGGNTTNKGGKLTFGVPSGFDNSSSAFNATTSPYPVSPEGPTWNSSSLDVNNVVRIQDSSKFAKLNVGMMVQEYIDGAIGSRISNSGVNRIAEKLTDNRIRLTYGGNSTLRYGELLFNNFCSSSISSSGSGSGSGFLYLKNTGDFTLVSMRITQSGTVLSGGNTVTWSTCGGVWTGTVCSISPATILTTTSSSGAQQLSLSLAPGGYVKVRAVSSPSGGLGTLSVSVSVSTSDLASAMNTSA